MRTTTAEAARGRWLDILLGLGIDETFLRNRHGPCPMCGGDDRFRFDDKDGMGTWFCNRCGAGRGTELVMKVKGCDFKTACAMIDPLVGNAKMRTEAKRADARPRLVRLWGESVPCQKGGEVDWYLSGRGLELPQGVREHPWASYYHAQSLVGRYPAMVSRLVAADGKKATTIHMTYLSGGNKAPVESPKKLLPHDGKLAGSAVRLYEYTDTLAIAEGIETAIAFKLLMGYPCWATTNASLLSQWMPPEGVRRVIVAGDNDANYVGQHHAYALADSLTRRGYAVEVRIPPNQDTDWCDVLQAYRSSGSGSATRQAV